MRIAIANETVENKLRPDGESPPAPDHPGGALAEQLERGHPRPVQYIGCDEWVGRRRRPGVALRTVLECC